MDLRSLRADAAHAGWIRALLARLIARLQRSLGLYLFRGNVRPLSVHPVEPAPPAGITLRPLRLDELLKAAADPELDLHPGFVRGAMADGSVAFGAFEGDRLVGCSWRTTSTAPCFEDLRVRIGDLSCCYAYNAFVRPSHRGRRIHVALTHFADRFSREKGCRAEIGFVNIANLPSLGAARSLGRRRVGYAGYLSLFGHCIPFRTAGIRRIGVELYRPAAHEPERLVAVRG